jgi:tRNA threonylcarbamoyladenosine biosynthesis protein TsaE
MADRVGSAAVLTQPELEAWGRAVGSAASLPLVVALRGPLGAGKSVLARAIARGAGVAGPMPSPTYNLLFTYDAADRGDVGGVGVHHLDLYRLEDPDDVWELGWEELGQGREIVLVEWPERAEPLLPPDRWEVRIDFVEGAGREGRRTVEVERRGDAPEPPSLPTTGPEGGPESGP